jgi:TolB-like protein/Tfp pilus assembly protein PilF
MLVVAVTGWWLLGRDADGGFASVTSQPSGDGRTAATIADTRPSVAVLYFDNLSGDESLDWLRSGLTELLVTDLSQSPELRVLTTDALYEILDETGNLEARVTSAAVVREVAARAEVDHVVVGSFIRAGDTFRLSARLQEAATGDVVAAETVEGDGEDSVFESIDTLTRRIKDRLSVPISNTAVVDRDLSDVTTASMDAYRHYTDGVNLISQGRYEEAIPVFERAIEIDPEFAMAFAKLAIVHGNIFDSDAARAYSAKAIEHADRLTQRERFYIEGRYYSQDSETTMQSIEAYENALALYPDDSASRNNVALEYGQLERHEEAIAHFEELLRRGSPFLPSYFNAAMAYVKNGDCERGYELIRDFVRRQPDYHFGYQDLAQVSMFCGRLEEARAALGAYDESIEAGAPADVLHGNVRLRLHILADEFDEALAVNEALANSTSPVGRYRVYPRNRLAVAGYRGDYADEMAFAVELAESMPDDASGKADLFGDIAFWYLEIGDAELALAFAEQSRALTRTLDQQVDLAALTAVAQARAGRSVAARTAAQQHERLSTQVPNPWARRQELRVAAEIALGQDDLEEAIDRLREAYELLQSGPDFPPFDELVDYSFALAEAHFAAGNRVEASELFGAVTEAGSQRIYHPFEYVRSFYYLGKIAAEDGNGSAARRNYQRFLDYWGDGEIDRDRVAEARAFVSGN